jgi:hypothetical protein
MMGWVWQVACMRGKRIAHEDLIGNPERRVPVGNLKDIHG